MMQWKRLSIATMAMASLLVGCATSNNTGFSPTLATDPTVSLSSPKVVAIDALLTQTRALLLLAPDVARIKWNGKIAIENASADNALVQAASQQAPKYQADPKLFADYFRAQLDASKFVQRELFAQWQSQKLPPVLTLTRTVAQVRAASDEITPQLMKALADAAPFLAQPGARGLIEARARDIMQTKSSLSDATRAMSIKPLLDRAAP